MKDSRRQSDDEAGESRSGARRRRWLWRPLLCVVGVAVLLYGSAQLWSRSPWFEDWLEARISRAVGMPVRIGRVRATESLNLKIRDIIGMTDEAGFEIKILRLRWHLFRRRHDPWLDSIRIEGLSLSIAPDADGQLHPAVFASFFKHLPVGLTAPAATGSGASPPPPPVEYDEAAVEPADAARMSSDVFWRDTDIPALSISHGNLQLRDAGGNPQLSVAGLTMEYAGRQVADGRQVRHIKIQAERVTPPTGGRIANLQMEMIELDGHVVVLSCTADEWGMHPPPVSKSDEYRALLDSI